jgi:hypothetical protein
VSGGTLSRRLGTADAVVLGLGSMLGAGVFAAFALSLDLRHAIGFSSFGVLLYHLVADIAAFTQTSPTDASHAGCRSPAPPAACCSWSRCRFPRWPGESRSSPSGLSTGWSGCAS